MSKKIKIVAGSLLLFLVIFFQPVKSFTLQILPQFWVKKIYAIKNEIFNTEEPILKTKVKSLTYTEVSTFFNADLIPLSRKIDDSLSYVYFDIPDIFPGKHEGAKNSAYIDFFAEGMVYVAANGVFFYLENHGCDSCFTMNHIKSNIQEVVTFPGFFEESTFGIKDIFIEDNIIYISCTLKKNDGYNTSIFSAEMNAERLVFSPFFIPHEFIKTENDYGSFNAHQSGGRISQGRKDSVLLSIGEYQYRDKAQSDTSINGKILSISKKTGGYRIVSKGHRNPQGLEFNEDLEIIVSTDHGPSGGDEINIDEEMDAISNFGWPISSYGYHYGKENVVSIPPEGDPEKWTMQGSPLYKSHAKYGFTEPLLFFEKNPGISQVKILAFDKSTKEIRIAVATMGYDWALSERPFARSILIYTIQLENKAIRLEKQYRVDERVRDLIYKKDKKQLIFIGETTGLIGFIDL
jgi:hypothetical protein